MISIELLNFLRKHIAIVVALPVACALAMVVACLTILPDEYTAEVSIYALARSGAAGTEGQSADDAEVTYQELQSSQLLANDFAELAQNRQVRKNVADSLGMKDLGGYDINIVSANTTRLIKLRVTGQNPKTAADIANALAEEVGQMATDVMGIEAVNVVNEAEPPEGRSGPPRKRYVLMTFIAGLFATVAGLILRDMLSTTVREEEVQELTGLPVVGRFPFEKGGDAV